ncbi:MAG: hypothetical protein ABJM12_22830, partial [Ekhidna sp.]
ELNAEDTIQAAIEVNAHFHLPEASQNTILIANGTGIAPFLGMIAENRTKSISLFWGARTEASAVIYNSVLHKIINQNEHVELYTTFSREATKQYVQDAVLEQKELVLNAINSGGTIMICGSLAMQHDVLDVLEHLLHENETISFEAFEKSEQLKTDCY